MGRLISGKTYPLYEYGVAVVIGAGVTMFIVGDKASYDDSKSTQTSGVLLLLGYLMFDSFTSQWQGHMFTTYKLSPYQMMVGINSFSACFTFISLLQSGELWTSLDFLGQNPEAMTHILGFAVAGASGQMFIYYTIKTFSPLVFTMISTTRQMISIILSTIIFGHTISRDSFIGAIVVFTSVLYRAYRKYSEKAHKKPKASAPQEPVPEVAVEMSSKEGGK